MICCCCGIYVKPGEGEEVIVGPDGKDDYMCRRCFNEECDCYDDAPWLDEAYEQREPPTGEAITPEELLVADYDDFDEDDDLPL